MTMLLRTRLFAVLGTFLLSGSIFSQETYRLGGTGFTPGTVQTLDYDGQASLEPVHWPAARFAVGVAAGGARFAVGAGVRVAVGGVRFALGPPFYWGGYYRPYFADYYRSYYWGGPFYSYYRPYYWSWNNRPYYWITYRPWVVYSTPIYYSSPVAANYSYQYSWPNQSPPPMPPADDSNGTYRYDGGPANPLPMPCGDNPPQRIQPKTIPLNGRIASLTPSHSPYLAYGESPQTLTTVWTSPTVGDQIRLIAQNPKLIYPAYGENSQPPSKDKTIRTAQANR